VSVGGKPTYVLGVGLSHNGSACLMQDGRIVAAIEKERLTGVKNDGGNDVFAVNYCLEAAGLRPRDLDLIVQNANFGDFRYGSQWRVSPRNLPEGVPVVTISHHLAHASSAFFLSPFERASVLVVDGCGNAFDECVDLDDCAIGETPPEAAPWLWFEKDSFYAAEGGGLRALYKDFSPWGRVGADFPLHSNTTRHSIGGLYLAASVYALGSASDLGKLMGLAPYGRAEPGLPEIFEFQDGRLRVNYDWIGEHTRRCASDVDFKARFQYFADVARRVQSEVERALLELARLRHGLAEFPDLCFAGGVAMNAVANWRILTEGPFRRLFVPPAADDAGLAIGCAYHGWNTVLGQPRVHHDGSPFLGRGYDAESIAAALAKAGDGLVVERPADLPGAVAELLAAGKVVGWFQGGAEFGPRALGHRSILADPRRAELRGYINAKVKFREDFRPFAPSVLAEEAGRYFELGGESPYMLLVAPVREDWRARIPAVVHVDGTARVQTVRRETDPRFHALLEAMQARTGLGMLLNTSLNRRGRPIVETPANAVELFQQTGLHALAIGDFLATKA
jgi:carbamoyltransferase